MYLRSSNSIHSILASVLCKKNEAILTQIPCFWTALDSSGTTWYGSANRGYNDVNKMAAPFSTSRIAFCLQTLEGI